VTVYLRLYLGDESRHETSGIVGDKEGTWAHARRRSTHHAGKVRLATKTRLRDRAEVREQRRKVRAVINRGNYRRSVTSMLVLPK